MMCSSFPRALLRPITCLYNRDTMHTNTAAWATPSRSVERCLISRASHTPRIVWRRMPHYHAWYVSSSGGAWGVYCD